MMKLDIRNKYAEENNLEGKDVIMEIIRVGGAKNSANKNVLHWPN